ncbi:MAG TPA: heparinase II/III family protein, partial [Nitrospiraceae bacterium]|nr:heparinase II/III family protein [Nitrospiraceae bacterium]
PQDVRTTIHHDGVDSTASHTGYDHLPGRPKHERQVVVGESQPFMIRDRVTGTGTHTVAGGFLLGPEWIAESIANGWLLKSGHQRLLVRILGPEGLQCGVDSRPWHPDYGIEIMTQRLRWQYHGQLPMEVSIRIAAAEEQTR